jgi:hypothetical protein
MCSAIAVLVFTMQPLSDFEKGKRFGVGCH